MQKIFDWIKRIVKNLSIPHVLDYKITDEELVSLISQRVNEKVNAETEKLSRIINIQSILGKSVVVPFVDFVPSECMVVPMKTTQTPQISLDGCNITQQMFTKWVELPKRMVTPLTMFSGSETNVEEISNVLSKMILGFMYEDVRNAMIKSGWKHHLAAVNDGLTDTLNIGVSNGKQTYTWNYVDTHPITEQTHSIHIELPIKITEKIDLARSVTSRVLAASNIIQFDSRTGLGQYVITNKTVGELFFIDDQNEKMFTRAGNSAKVNDYLTHIGKIANLDVYVDNTLSGEETFVIVGRKGESSETGLSLYYKDSIEDIEIKKFDMSVEKKSISCSASYRTIEKSIGKNGHGGNHFITFYVDC